MESGETKYQRTFCYDPILDEWTEVSLTNFDRISSASIVFKINYGLLEGYNSAIKVESYDTTTQLDNREISSERKKTRHRPGFLEVIYLSGGRSKSFLDSIDVMIQEQKCGTHSGNFQSCQKLCCLCPWDLLHIFDGVGNASGVCSNFGLE